MTEQMEQEVLEKLGGLASKTGLEIGGGKIRRTSSRFCLGVEHGDYNGTELFGVGTDRFIWLAYKPNHLGRIRLLPEIDSRNRNVRQFAERTAVNTPIQGSAADLIKLAMIQVHARLQKDQLQAAMLLSVHDEIVLEAPPEEREVVMDLVRTVMEGVWDLKVPLKVNVAGGSDWAEAH